MKDSKVWRSVLHYTNKERRKYGLPKVISSKRLRECARSHSQWMAKYKKFSHTGTMGSSPSHRALLVGYPNIGVSENIWMIKNGGKLSSWNLGRKAVRDWMGSEGHRRNLLDPRWKYLGTGTAQRGSKIYITQNFSGPRGGVRSEKWSRRSVRDLIEMDEFDKELEAEHRKWTMR